MPNRNRKLYIALGIAALILAIYFVWSVHSFKEYQKNHAQNRENISAYQAETVEQYPEVCFNEGNSFVTLFKCLIKTVDSNRSAQRTQYDLQAQQEMAEWAYGLLLLTAAGFFASVIGLIALFYSLGLNRRALLIAVRGNRNAIRAINQEQRNAEKQSRAYVYIKGIDMKERAGDKIWRAELEIVNFGQTPAYDVRIWVRWEHWLQPEAQNAITRPTSLVESPMDIAPSQLIRIDARSAAVFTPAQIKAIDSGQHSIFIYGDIVYWDVFREVRRHTNFRMKYSGLGFSGTTEGNSSD